MTLFPFWLTSLGITGLACLWQSGSTDTCLLLLFAHLAIFSWAVVDFRLPFFMRVFYRSPAGEQRIALTFDDGPDPQLTEQVLDLLKRYNCRATFFVVARRVEQFPHIVRRAFDEGHTIACHDLNHAWDDNLRLTGRMVRDIGEAVAKIEAVIGTRPRLYRPPVGLLNPHLPTALKQLGMHCIGWSHSVRDAGNRRPATFVRIPELAQAGAVVLLHDVLPNPEHGPPFLAQLETLLHTCHERGVKAVGVEELFGLAAYQA